MPIIAGVYASFGRGRGGAGAAFFRSCSKIFFSTEVCHNGGAGLKRCVTWINFAFPTTLMQSGRYSTCKHFQEF